jgi:hypothetical protein
MSDLATLRLLPKKLIVTHLPGVLVDEDDLPVTLDWAWAIKSTGYVFGMKTIAPKKRIATYLHRLIMGYPDGLIDHINGDKLDNRRSNLRVADQTINQINRHKVRSDSGTGIRGVTFMPRLSAKHPWRAEIGYRGRHYHIGMFASADEAFVARREAELRIWGINAPLVEP